MIFVGLTENSVNPLPSGGGYKRLLLTLPLHPGTIFPVLMALVALSQPAGGEYPVLPVEGTLDSALCRASPR